VVGSSDSQSCLRLFIKSTNGKRGHAIDAITAGNECKPNFCLCEFGKSVDWLLTGEEKK